MLDQGDTTALLSNPKVPCSGVPRYISYVDEAGHSKDPHRNYLCMDYGVAEAYATAPLVRVYEFTTKFGQTDSTRTLRSNGKSSRYWKSLHRNGGRTDFSAPCNYRLAKT